MILIVMLAKTRGNTAIKKLGLRHTALVTIEYRGPTLYSIFFVLMFAPRSEPDLPFSQLEVLYCRTNGQ